MIGILLALLVLLAQFHFGVIGSDGIHGRVLSIISPYVALMGAFVIYHAVRTPWLISNDHLDSIKATESAKTALQQELESLKQVPPTIEVRMIELYRKPVNSGRDGNPKDGFLWDIFLSVWIELKSPLTASITGYRMQLSLHGNRMSLQAQNDLDEWGLDIWKPTVELAHAELTPLSPQLKRGEPMEGWLHFISEQATPKVLDECTVRLIADSGRGSAYKEYLPDPHIWNPNTDKRFNRKS